MTLRSALDRLPIDRFLMLLIATVVLAAILPARGFVAEQLDWITFGAIALLFFLYGARLSPQSVWQGLLHWRLQGFVFCCTYVAFPLIALAAAALVRGVLPPELVLGILFIGALPSTVQSSIAFTSVAGGNVPAALTSASVSNLLGIVMTPAIVMLIASSQGGFSLDAVEKIALQLLAPFIAGQCVRPLIAGWLSRHKPVTTIVDRGSILLVVYAAFSEGVVSGIWTELALRDLLIVALVDMIVLAVVLVLTSTGSRALRFSRGDRIAIVFCGSKKSMATGIPMAGILFPGHAMAAVVLPLMLFHQIQLFACAVIAQRFAKATQKGAEPTTGDVMEREHKIERASA